MHIRGDARRVWDLVQKRQISGILARNRLSQQPASCIGWLRTHALSQAHTTIPHKSYPIRINFVRATGREVQN